MRGARLLAAAMLLANAGCSSFPGHPVRLSQPRIAQRPAAPALAADPAPTDVAADRAGRSLFGGVLGLWRETLRVHQRRVERSRKPTLVPLPQLEASVLARYRGGGFGGPVRHVVAMAVTGHVPLSPQRMADLMGDPAVERALLAARSFRRIGIAYRWPGVLREHFRVEMPGMGPPMLRRDVRFSVAAERWDLSDGRVLTRSDPLPASDTRGVTLYRGACLLEPTADGGSRVSEVLIMGTDVPVPPFLTRVFRRLAVGTLENRATNLWARAWR